jgi:hypothetical protein
MIDIVDKLNSTTLLIHHLLRTNRKATMNDLKKEYASEPSWASNPPAPKQIETPMSYVVYLQCRIIDGTLTLGRDKDCTEYLIIFTCCEIEVSKIAFEGQKPCLLLFINNMSDKWYLRFGIYPYLPLTFWWKSALNRMKAMLSAAKEPQC